MSRLSPAPLPSAASLLPRASRCVVLSFQAVPPQPTCTSPTTAPPDPPAPSSTGTSLSPPSTPPHSRACVFCCIAQTHLYQPIAQLLVLLPVVGQRVLDECSQELLAPLDRDAVVAVCDVPIAKASARSSASLCHRPTPRHLTSSRIRFTCAPGEEGSRAPSPQPSGRRLVFFFFATTLCQCRQCTRCIHNQARAVCPKSSRGRQHLWPRWRLWRLRSAAGPRVAPACHPRRLGQVGRALLFQTPTRWLGPDALAPACRPPQTVPFPAAPAPASPRERGCGQGGHKTHFPR
jgi:hypothetical protein